MSKVSGIFVTQNVLAVWALEWSEGALKHNLSVMQSKILSSTKTMEKRMES